VKSGFYWGVASSAYQTEGAHESDGKGPSVWDDFTTKRRKILNGHHANDAVRFYDFYKNDLKLLSELGIPNFRFSISWPRIFPDGIGPVNRKGIDFYLQLIDTCLQLGIEPWVTLFHWDYPLMLQYRGGWTNRDSVNWFSEYVHRCVKEFGSSIHHWMVMNEPVVFTGAGHFLGVHAPGMKGISNYLAAVHHVALSQAAGIRIIKEAIPNAHVGTTFSCSKIDAYSESNRDKVAAVKVDAILNRLFIDPLAGLGYPIIDFPNLRKIEKYFQCDDAKNLSAPFDFIGIQNYTREVVASAWWMPFIKAKIITAEKRKVFRTAMNWEVYPSGIYEMIKKFSSYPAVKEIIVTENGASFHDNVINENINDHLRINFLQDYIKEVERARQDGYPVKGYFVWSFTDNFEWAEGYRPRFGLVHVDYKTMKRTVKESGHWYSKYVQESEART
jgi:beta-glucosidase